MTSVQHLKIVSRNIKRLRVARHLSQADLATKAKCSVTMICRLEKAERDISLKLMVKIATSLGVGIRQLIEEHREHKTKVMRLDTGHANA